MARELFGTDGLRGVAGEYPLDPPTICAVGVALGRLARRLAADPEVILGIDTRESGPATGFLRGLPELLADSPLPACARGSRG
mgnify:CR=1 FL=1